MQFIGKATGTLVRDPFEVYSSIVVGSSKGSEFAKLFVSALGQPIPRLGKVPPALFPAHSALTTNLMRAAQLGAALGDFTAHALRLDFIGGSLEDVQALIDTATYRLKVSAREMSAGGLRDLPHYLDSPIKIDRNDTLDMEIAVEPRMVIAHPFLLRAALVGCATYDVR